VIESLSYDDVLLKPQYSDIRSRTEVSTQVELGNNLTLRVPILASPMDTISETAMAVSVGLYGGAAIVHRYNSIQEQADIVTMAKQIAEQDHNKNIVIGAAIGVTDDYLNRAAVLNAIGVNFICVDVAHGHHVLMKDALQTLRNKLGGDIHIMAGNVATLEGINDLADWGADSVRCNIGGGSICSTRIETGHGMPGLQTILDCAATDRKVTIIADGGIRNSGDMVKALAAGADCIMCGSMLSGTDETPGTVFEESDGTRWKTYRGMASKEAQISWRGKFSSHEGVSARVPYRGSVTKILESLERGLRSGLSYSGCRTITELHAKAEFVRQTAAGLGESKTHILSRNW